jgi:hypothetical protein
VSHQSAQYSSLVEALAKRGGGRERQAAARLLNEMTHPHDHSAVLAECARIKPLIPSPPAFLAVVTAMVRAVRVNPEGWECCVRYTLKGSQTSTRAVRAAGPSMMTTNTPGCSFTTRRAFVVPGRRKNPDTTASALWRVPSTPALGTADAIRTHVERKSRNQHGLLTAPPLLVLAWPDGGVICTMDDGCDVLCVCVCVCCRAARETGAQRCLCLTTCKRRVTDRASRPTPSQSARAPAPASGGASSALSRTPQPWNHGVSIHFHQGIALG